MKLQCPKCKALLKQIGPDVAPGNSVECGECGHVWKIYERGELLTSRSKTGGRAKEKSAPLPSLLQTAPDRIHP